MKRKMPDIDYIADAPWPRRSSSRVWRVHVRTHSVYVKMSRNALRYQREVYAYRHAAAALGAGRAPRLLDTDPRLGVIMTSTLPGSRVLGLKLRAEQERTVHSLAGGLLRRWHDLERPDPAARARAIADVDEKVDAATSHVPKVSHLLSDRHRKGIERASQVLRLLAPYLPIGFRHGDFQARNWQWDSAARLLGLFDFEDCGNGIVVEDFVWLAADTWPSHPQLKAACQAGYGRDFSADEARALDAYSVLAVLDDLQWAYRNANAAEVARAVSILEQVIPRLY
ncbi:MULTISPECIES: aminoglycoside phosphotransferase family protein [Streptomyces]|uniref:aminoglycoside phosphotransferase family protein n=1 Tax=Streptomyces TaxID=1883 RepID=UPI000AAC1489|nr:MULTISPECIES: aminoglycoside phosphotransferase family protein [Streptomyces]